jgi:hypothetical protein
LGAAAEADPPNAISAKPVANPMQRIVEEVSAQFLTICPPIVEKTRTAIVENRLPFRAAKIGIERINF